MSGLEGSLVHASERLGLASVRSKIGEIQHLDYWIEIHVIDFSNLPIKSPV